MLRINEKDYELIYDINVMCKMAGAGLDVMGEGIERITSSLPNLRKAFYFGLMHDNKKITEVRAGELMSQFLREGNGINDVMEEVVNQLSYALGVGEDVEDEKEEEGKQHLDK